MMPNNIFGSLHLAKQGMNASLAGLNVTGQNVANANTEGYSRKQIALSPRPGPPFGGGGVDITGLKRYTDEFANTRLVEEETLLGFANQRSDILKHVSDLFNDLDDTALGSAFDNFFGAWRNLQTTPTDVTARQEVLARGEELAQTFNRIWSDVEGVRQNTDNLLQGAVADVNLRVERIAGINEQINLSVIRGEDISDLLDQRDLLVREIAEYVDVSAVNNKNSQIDLFLEGGTPLVLGVEFSTLELDAAGGPGTATIKYVSSNGSSLDITSKFQGGAIGAVFYVRDTLLPSFINDFDQLAFDMITEVNAQHQLGFGLDGVGLRDFFAPVGAVANAAAVMSLDAAVDGNPDAIAGASAIAGLPGDNINILAMADLASQKLSGGGTQTFNEAYATLVGEIGVESRRANDEAAMRQTAIEHVETLRDQTAGVSLDEEMTNLIQFQRAYQASSRVLSVIDQMINEIIQLR